MALDDPVERNGVQGIRAGMQVRYRDEIQARTRPVTVQIKIAPPRHATHGQTT